MSAGGALVNCKLLTVWLPQPTEQWRIRPCLRVFWFPGGWWRSWRPLRHPASPPEPGAAASVWQNKAWGGEREEWGQQWGQETIYLLWSLGEGHPCEGRWEGLSVHLTASTLRRDSQVSASLWGSETDLDVLILPDGHVVTGLPGPHGEEVCHHGAESRGETGLGDEAQLELGQTDDVVSLLPVPAGDVQ